MCSRPEFKWGYTIQAMIGHHLHLNICLEQPDKLAVADHIFNQDHNIQLHNTKSSLSHLTTWISSSGDNWDGAPSQNGKGGWPNHTWLMTSHSHPYRTLPTLSLHIQAFTHTPNILPTLLDPEDKTDMLSWNVGKNINQPTPRRAMISTTTSWKPKIFHTFLL